MLQRENWEQEASPANDLKRELAFVGLLVLVVLRLVAGREAMSRV